MRVVHWTAFAGSGMANVAGSIAQAEFMLGMDSTLVNIHKTTTEELDKYADADIHVTHTHFPDEMRKRITKPYKLVWVGHGTPEHVFYSAIESGKQGYGHGDSLMLMLYWLQHADARVTFWPRHKAIYDTMIDKGTKVDSVPLGVERDFWGAGESKGKFAGSPSVFSAENSHQIKWPLDLFLMWPWIYREIPGACLHAAYVPNDQSRWWFPLIDRNGAAYGSHVSAFTFPHTELRNVFKSVDYQFSHVRYGDFNRLCLEAAASGCKVISYKGNPYADYWVSEGDQRTTAAELLAILRGDTEPRKDKSPVVDISETALAMRGIYEELLDSPSQSMVTVPAKLRRSDGKDRRGKRGMALRNHPRGSKSR